MARMIFNQMVLDKAEDSEKLVFGKLKALPEDWTVFHSVAMFDERLPMRQSISDAEADFVVYHPKEGILVLEVKGGRVQYSGGQWYVGARKAQPFGQVRRNKYCIKKLLERRLKDKAAILFPFADAVCFPMTSIQSAQALPPESEYSFLPRAVLDDPGRLYSWIRKSLGIRLAQELDEAMRPVESKPRSFAQLPAAKEEDVLRVLCPDVDAPADPSLYRAFAAEQAERLTMQQRNLVSALANFRRLSFRGCAGCGKTFLALQKAKALADDGMRVLMLCYNSLLAEKLRDATIAYPEIETGAFFEFCKEKLGIPPESIEKHEKDSRMYTDVLVNLLVDHFDKTGIVPYDAVIVDEGQDFTDLMWKGVRKLLAPNAVFYVFYDPDQDVFRGGKIPDFGIPPVSLSDNCRNTRAIAAGLRDYATGTINVADGLPEGTPPATLVGNVRVNLAELLHRIAPTTKGLKSVVVLGAHSLANTSIGENADLDGYTLVQDPPANAPGNVVRYYTYMKFKGLEAPIVILVDVDETDPRWDRVGLYTAMSRASSELYILRASAPTSAAPARFDP